MHADSCSNEPLLRPRNGAIALLALNLITLQGPLSVDLNVPVLPQMAAHFGADLGSMHLTVSFFLAGYGLGEFVFGALSDAVGRRPVLVGALCAHMLTASALALAPSVAVLQALRLVHGLAAGPPVVIAQAVVPELWLSKPARERVTGVLSATRALSAVIGPVAGAQLGMWLGWRATFSTNVALAACACACVCCALRLPAPRASASARRVLLDLKHEVHALLSDLVFVGVVAAEALSYSGHMTFLVSSSSVLQETYRLAPRVYSLAYAANAAFYVAGSLMSPLLSTGWLCRACSHSATLRAGALAALGSSALMLGLSWPAAARRISPWLSLVLPAFGYAFGRGLITVQCLTIAAERHPTHAGGAAGLVLALRGVVASAVLSAVGCAYTRVAASGTTAEPAPAWIMAVVMLGMAVLTSALAAAVGCSFAVDHAEPVEIAASPLMSRPTSRVSIVSMLRASSVEDLLAGVEPADGHYQHDDASEYDSAAVAAAPADMHVDGSGLRCPPNRSFG